MNNKIGVETIHLFPILDKLLITLLAELTEEEWNAQTVARLWKVKDVASHLLDGNLRTLSTSRDHFFGETPGNISTYAELVDFLNHLNLSWTSATRRLSPQVLTWLLDITGQQYTTHLKTLDPFGDAIFPVAWAGQDTSPNWFHIAREYTEKFVHQQQIRDAVNKPGLMTRTLYYPFMDTLMYAFPYTFKDVHAEEGTVVSIIIPTDIGGRWNIIRDANSWTLDKQPDISTAASITIDPVTAWKLFSKSWHLADVIDKVTITGNMQLGEQALNMVSVMA